MNNRQAFKDMYRHHIDAGHRFYQKGDLVSAKGAYLLAFTCAFFRADIEEIAISMVYLNPDDSWTKELLSYLISTAKKHSDYYAIGIIHKSVPGGKRQAHKYFATAYRLASTDWAKKAIKEELELTK